MTSIGHMKHCIGYGQTHTTWLIGHFVYSKHYDQSALDFQYTLIYTVYTHIHSTYIYIVENKMQTNQIELKSI